MSAAEGVLTLTALFQDNATTGLKAFTSGLNAAASAADQAQSGLSPFNSVLGTTASAVESASGSFQPFNAGLTEVGSIAGETVGRLGPLGSIFTETGASAERTVGAIGPLGSIFTEVAAESGNAAERLQTLPSVMSEASTSADALRSSLTGTGTEFTAISSEADGTVGGLDAMTSAMDKVQSGSLTTKNTLVELGSEMTTMSTTANTTGTATVGLGTKIGLVGGFIAGTAGSVVGLISGFTGLESASDRLGRAQTTVASTAHNAETAYNAYLTAVQKFGPSSEEARSKLEAYNIALQRHQDAINKSETLQKTFNDRLLEFGTNAVSTAGNLAMLGSTLTILKTNMGLTSAATAENTIANVANRASMLGMVGEAGPLGSAFKATTAAEGEASLATEGLGLRFLALAAPIGIAIGLFALIETNTFGMGDAFRATATAIAVGIDDILNGIVGLWNGFVGLLNNLAQFQATIHNEFITVENDVITALNGMLSGAAAFVNSFDSTVVGIANFFISSVINPIITGWDTFMKGLATAVNSVSSQIINAFTPIVSGIVDKMVQIGDAWNSTMKFMHLPPIDLKPLTDLQYQLHNTQTTAEQSGAGIDKAFGQIKSIAPLNTSLGQVHASLLQTASGYESTATAGHTFDSLLREQNITVAESINNVVQYYSHWDNLRNLITSNIPGPLKNLIELLVQQGGAVGANIEKVLGLTSATQANSSATTAATATQQKHNEVLSASVSAAEAYSKAIADAKAQLVDQTTKEVQTTAATMELASANGFAAKGVADAAKAYADAKVKLETYLGALTNSTAVMNTFQAGIVSGKAKLLEFAQQSVQTGAEDQTFGQGLKMLADQLGFERSGLEATTQNLQDWVNATNGGTQALDSVKKALADAIGGFYAFGDAITKTLGDAMSKGSKEFNKSLKDLAQQTGISFSALKDDMGLKIAAGMSEAEGYLKAGLGVMTADMASGRKMSAEEMNGWMNAMGSAIQGATPEVIAKWQHVFDLIKAIWNAPVGQQPALIGQLKTAMEGLNVSAGEQADLLAALPSKYQGVASAAHTLSAAVQTVISGYQAMGDKVDKTTGIVTNSAGVFIGKMNLQTGAMSETGAAATKLATDLAELNVTRILAEATQQYTIDIDAMARALVQSSTDAGTFSTAINKLATSIGTTNNALATAQRGIDNVAQATTQGTTDMNVFNRAVNTVGQTVNTTNADVGRFATGMGALNRAADSALSAINTDFGGIQRTINTDMTSAATDVNTQTGRMLSSVNTNFGAILRSINDDMNNAVRDVTNAGGRIISEFNAIGNSALSQVSKINSLISRMNAIPNISRTITITTVFRTVGSPSGGGGGGGVLLSPVTGASGAAGSTTTAVTNTQPIIVSSPQDNRPIIVQLDSQVVGRLIKKNLFSLSGGHT